jgi:abortive infection bacteriophage resistance protein
MWRTYTRQKDNNRISENCFFKISLFKIFKGVKPKSNIQKIMKHSQTEMKQLSMNDQEKESLKILGIKNSY